MMIQEERDGAGDGGGHEADPHGARDRRDEAEELFRTTFEQAAVGIAHVTPDGRWIRVNERLCAILGYGYEEILARSLDDLTHPEDVGSDAADVEALLAGRIRSYTRELRYVRKDGALLWIAHTRSLVRTRTGRPAYFIVVLEDVSARKRVETAHAVLVRASASLASSLDLDVTLEQAALAAVPDLADLCAIHLAREDGSLQQAISVLRDAGGGEPLRRSDAGPATGSSPAALAVATARPVFLPDAGDRGLGTDAAPADPAAGIQAAGSRSLISIPLVARERTLGAITFVLTAGARTYDELDLSTAEALGRRVALALDNALLHGRAMREIEERKRAQEELRDSEARFRATFEQAAVGLAHLSPDGRWLRVNQRLCEIVGYSREELLRLSLREITDPEDLPACLEQAERLLAGEIPSYSLETRYRRKDRSTVWVQLTVSLVRTLPGETGYLIAVIEDVSERKSLEEQFLKAQKMEAVGRLAGGIAHDFNNVLGAIIGFANFLLLELGESGLRTHVHEILAAANRATSLTRQLLLFSSSRISEVTAVDVNAVAAGVGKMADGLIGEDVELRLDLDPEVGLVRANQSQIEQVILNLVVNSRDAMPSGGHIRIETRRVELAEEFARTHLGVRPGPYVRLAVSDDGEGMSREVRKHIFEPFFTTKEAGSGTGLGLATVYGIVRQAGGSIEVHSEEGRGTTFEIYLPRLDRPEEPAAPREAARPATGSESVLLVEDDRAVRMVGRRFLEQHGYRVTETASGAEALDRFSRAPDEFDLLVTDLVMPGMGGRELAERIAALRPGIRVLFTSGYTGDERLRSGILGANVAFLEKPFGPQELAAKVRELLDAEREQGTEDREG